MIELLCNLIIGGAEAVKANSLILVMVLSLLAVRYVVKVGRNSKLKPRDHLGLAIFTLALLTSI
jgi:hypothetical protein